MEYLSSFLTEFEYISLPMQKNGYQNSQNSPLLYQRSQLSSNTPFLGLIPLITRNGTLVFLHSNATYFPLTTLSRTISNPKNSPSHLHCTFLDLPDNHLKRHRNPLGRFLLRDNYAKRGICRRRVSVCVSITPGILSKWLNVGSCK